jgi:hypothetical protein
LSLTTHAYLKYPQNHLNLNFRLNHLSRLLLMFLKNLMWQKSLKNLHFLMSPRFHLSQMSRLSLMCPCFLKNLCFHLNLPNRLFLMCLLNHLNPKNHLNHSLLKFLKNLKLLNFHLTLRFHLSLRFHLLQKNLKNLKFP